MAMNSAAALRAALIGILTEMGEIKQADADRLVVEPGADMDLAQLNFDSLTLLDFCLKVETRLGLEIDPDEAIQFDCLSELEAELARRKSTN